MQHKFAELLIDLGELLRCHTDVEQARDAVPSDDTTACDMPPPENVLQTTNSEEELP